MKHDSDKAKTAVTRKESKVMVGVIGASVASAEEARLAREVGRMLARAGYVVVCGGLGGVMEQASMGAWEEGGEVVGILPGSSKSDANPFVTHPIVTNMNQARNVIIAHTADFLIAVGGEYGTLSEIAFGLKLGKKVFSLKSWKIEGVIEVLSLDELERLLGLQMSKRTGSGEEPTTRLR
jgi:uncharacterized protein (TIGR00725 family)